MEPREANSGMSVTGTSVSPMLAAKLLLVVVASLALVSYADYATGDDFLFFVFYFVPVALCGWFLGYGTTLALALMSALSWFLVDRLSGHRYPNEAIRYWNGLLCFVAFAAIGLVLHRLRLALSQQERVQQELLKALEELNRSTEEIRKLQSELQVVCAWTKRIRVNGQWVPLEEFLADKLRLSISHGISPEAFERLKASFDRQERE